jgi:hypothetical protein
MEALKRFSVIAVVIAWAGCSKNGGNQNNSMTTDGGITLPSSCISASAIQVVFSPMFSAYDGVHRFQVPAIVVGIDPTIVQWTSSDTSVATVESDMVVGGTMVTVQGAGTATIVAQAGNLCGASLLTVDSATPDEWQQGSDRYNNGITYSRQHGDMGLPDGSSNEDPACTNCHGPTAMNRFVDVAHTPEQIGGFSDQVLGGIMQMGDVPDGGYFDPTIVPYRVWQSFHHWQLTDEDVKGVIVYLRSLTPTPQTGSSNFGGRGPDGGFGGPHDAGAHD